MLLAFFAGLLTCLCAIQAVNYVTARDTALAVEVQHSITQQYYDGGRTQLDGQEVQVTALACCTRGIFFLVLAILSSTQFNAVLFY